LIGFNAAAFLDLRTGFGGGNIVNRRSATTGATFAFGIVDVTEIVVDEPEVDVCNFAGNGLPGDFLANCGLTIFGERVAVFLAGAFLAGAFLAGAFLAGAFFTATFFAGTFLAGAFLLAAFLAGAFLLPFLNNFFIVATTP
jgi:hypothetical protein